MVPACLAIFGLLCLIFYLVHDHSGKEEAWAKERNLLLTRIQAPQLAATLAHTDEQVELVEAPILGADGDFYEFDGKRVQ